jgi:exopolysaccharide production protein ExoZ
VKRIVLLQGLRAAAALAVTIHHLLHEPYGAASAAWLSRLPWEAGVDVFFVISGFVMVYASRRLFGAPRASRIFLHRRLARIVPLYWASTTVFLVVAMMRPEALNSPSPTPAEILASYAFIPWARADGLIQPVYSLGWTLNYEMLFYAVFALFLPLSRGKTVISVTACLGVAVTAGWLYPPGVPALIFWSNPLVLEFVVGMGLALLAERGLALPNALRLAMAVLGLGLLMPNSWNGAFVPPFMAGASMLAAGCVLGPDPRVPRLLFVWMQRLGDASYGLYLLHPFALRAVTLAWGALGLTSVAAASLASATALGLALSAALVSYARIEAPLMRSLGSSATAPRPTGP